jgi:hypothetical protein
MVRRHSHDYIPFVDLARLALRLRADVALGAGMEVRHYCVGIYGVGIHFVGGEAKGR